MIKTFLLEDLGFSDFSICNAGEHKCEPYHKFGPFIRNHYLIHFVVAGEGSFKTPRGEYKIGAGEAFLIKPGEVTVYEADGSNPWEYFWLGFVGTCADNFAALPDIFEYDADIVNEFYTGRDMKFGKEAYFTSIIFKLYASLFGEGKNNDYSKTVISYINTHYMENVTISGIADILGLNRKYLARIFKEHCGVSMQQYLINKRLHEAKKLLKLGYNVEQSAYMVGYNDPFGFSKAFKKRYGVSPISIKGTK